MRFLLRCLVPLLTLPLAAATLHVASDAKTGGDGTPKSPYSTVAAAVTAGTGIRSLKPTENITVVLGNGRHELRETLRLGPAQSGFRFEAKSPVKAILSGGVRLTGWQPDPARSGLWKVALPEVKSGNWYFYQLFVNGERVQRARTPNTGFFQTAGKLGGKSPISLPFKAGDIKPEWAALPDARLIMLMKWTDLQLPIRSVDVSANVALLPGGPRDYWMDEPDARYWVENVPDALDLPGEWYLDRTSGLLSFLAPAGVDPNRAEVVAPRLRELVVLEGDVSKGLAVSDVTFAGLSFSDSDYDMPAEGMISPQSAVPVRGAVRATHAVNCRLEDCTLRNLAGYALDLGRGAQGWRVVGNTLSDIGGGGIRLGEPGDRTPSAFDACHSHVVTDNEIVRLGRVFSPGCGVIIFQSGTNRIAHNHIADLYYTGISIGWNWGYESTPCRENVIEFNLVEKVGQGRLSDMGGFYTLGPQPGTVIRNNVFRDVQSYRYGGWALYTDEGSTGIVVENNVAYRCKDAGFHQHYGRDNVIRNNLLAWNENHSVMRTRAEEHRSFWFTNNVIITRSGTLLGSNWGGTTNQFWSDANVWFDARIGSDAAKYQFAGKPWAAWQARGLDPHSVIADPLLVDEKRPELGLRKKSPAFKLGYRQIDLSTLGPRKPAQRK
jgi:parallel beta-helix repeat protein